MTRPSQEETALLWWCFALTNKDPKENRSQVAPVPIHRSAWKMNSRMARFPILNVQLYVGVATRLSSALMGRMLPQDVVGLDGYAGVP